VITLLSDFGLQDGYVGMMKGAIAHIDPTLPVIDLTHQIRPQNIAQARFVLMTSFPYFPSATVHVAVVDPGVGGKRRSVAIAVGNASDSPTGFLVGPDNGLFSGILEQHSVLQAVELKRSQYWRTPQPSLTFHGRDIFAPVAAHIASGLALSEFGPLIAPDSLIRLPLPPLIQNGNTIQGCIQAIDHFGNLVTTIPASALKSKNWLATVGNTGLPNVTTYSDRPSGTPIALIGSHGWVEIAITNGNAHETLNLACGDSVTITFPELPFDGGTNLASDRRSTFC
jgi:hypothetical protein